MFEQKYDDIVFYTRFLIGFIVYINLQFQFKFLETSYVEWRL